MNCRSVNADHQSPLTLSPAPSPSQAFPYLTNAGQVVRSLHGAHTLYLTFLTDEPLTSLLSDTDRRR